ncbi:MAG: hypothetical protein ACO1N0_14205 [Fluviicola sp.]
MTDLIEICGEQFSGSITHFSFKRAFTKIENMRELEQFSQFRKLTSASFPGTNLDDYGLSFVTQCKHIDNLNLQETEITNQGISHLKNLIHLKYLRLKENDQLDNSCIPFLNDCQNLIDLQIHETSINQEGLRELHIPGLKDLIIDVWDNNFDFEFLKEYSLKYPECAILAKGKGVFLNGTFNGEWTN